MLLNELPQETLLHIFNYIPCLNLWKDVRPVCKTFSLILTRDIYWITRADIKYNLSLPDRLKVKHENKNLYLPVSLCNSVELAIEKYQNSDLLLKPKMAENHAATVDAVKIFKAIGTRKNFCLTGSRDRSLILWDMNAVKKKEKDLWVASSQNFAHNGWIWQICVRGDSEVYSAGWDRYLKQWFITESSFRTGNKLLFDTAVLSCLSDDSSLIYVSTFTSGPIRCDTRSKLSILDKLRCHGTKSVFTMATGSTTNYVYSLGEDNRLVSVDKRNFKSPVNSIQLNYTVSRVHYFSGYLALSFRNGLLQFRNPTTLELEQELWIQNNNSLKPKEECSNEHFSLALSLGCTYSAFGSNLKIYTAGLKPKLLAKTPLNAIITQIDCFQNSLVAGTAMGTVCFWQ